jgi:hypothetical protein
MLYLILALVVIVLIAQSFKEELPGQKNKKYKAKTLMTDNEFEFFNRLIKALPQYYIFPQVSLGAILEGDSSDYKERNRIRLTFAQKMADYVIYDQNKKIVAIIELDDKTHNKEKDDKRDVMTSAAGYKTIRFESKKKPTIEEISNIFNKI